MVPDEEPPSSTRAALTRALSAEYELRDLLGRGGFAEVYAAWDARLKREVAIKTLRPEFAQSPDVVGRFRREAEALARLRHPNIVPVFSVGEANGLTYMVMPRIAGTSLADAMRSVERWSVTDVCRILGEAARALAEAHREGLVHRDVKPENLMLEGSSRRVVVMDFGIAKSVALHGEAFTATGVVIGTPQYMSPEQATGSGEVTAQSDQYSLGVVGYHLLTGRLPFDGPNAQSVIYRHAVETPTPIATLRPDVPATLRGAIERSLAKDPAERWAWMDEFADAIVTAQPENEGTLRTRRLRSLISRGRHASGGLRRRATATILLVAGGVMAGGIALRVWSPAGTRAPAIARVVAVMPFSVRGSDRIGYLGDGMVDLLTTDITRAARLEGIDPNTLLALVASQGARLIDPDRAREIAAGLGAGLFVLGSVFEVEGRMRITASLYDRSRGGRAVATKTIEGNTTDALSLVARLAADLAGAVPSDDTSIGARLVWSGTDVDALGSPSADGTLLSFTDWLSGDLAVRDLAGGSNRRLMLKNDWSSDEYTERSTISPDGRRIAYAWFNTKFEYELRIAGLDGSSPRTLLTADWLAPYGWTPDGSAVLVDAWNDAGGRLLWVGTGGSPIDTVRSGVHGVGPYRLSSDGRWIAFDAPAEDDVRRRDIYVISAAGSEETVVVRSPSSDFLLGWTPDGRHLLFWSDRGSSPGVWAIPIVVGRAAGPARLVRGEMQWMRGIGFSGADFLYQVFASERHVHTTALDIARGAVLEAPVPVLQHGPHATASAAWSHDGTRLAYVRSLPGAPPGTGVVAVRELSTGAETEYAVGMDQVRLVQWLSDETLLVRGRRPTFEEGHYQLELRSGALADYPISARFARGLVVSRDGRSQYYFRYTGPVGELVRRDRDSGREVVLMRPETGGAFALSPDEQQLVTAFYSRARGRIEIQLLPVAGGAPRLVHASTARITDYTYTTLAWTREGRHILYIRSLPEGGGELRSILPSGEGDRLVVALSGQQPTELRPHPDGRRFAFTAGDSRSEIWALMRPAAGLVP